VSTPVKLASALPGGNANGLGAILDELTRDPEGKRVVIGIVDTKKLETDIDTGEVVPTVRFLRLEALTGMDLKAGKSLFRRAFFKRTNRDTLPIEMEEELAEAFGETGFQTTIETDR
jgi:hypothetical protein